MSKDIQKDPSVLNPDLNTGVDAKKMLKNLAKDNRKIRLGDRKKVEIIKDTRFYKKGKVIKPHVTFAEQLISSKIAKEIK